MKAMILSTQFLNFWERIFYYWILNFVLLTFSIIEFAFIVTRQYNFFLSLVQLHIRIHLFLPLLILTQIHSFHLLCPPMFYCSHLLFDLIIYLLFHLIYLFSHLAILPKEFTCNLLFTFDIQFSTPYFSNLNIRLKLWMYIKIFLLSDNYQFMNL